MASGATGTTNATKAAKSTKAAKGTKVETTSTAGPSDSFKRVPPSWMKKPADVENCPDGLQYLAGLDQVFVEQGMDYDKVIAKLAYEFYYVIKNNQGEIIYYAVESSGDCCKFMCGERRNFDIKIYDQTGKAILKLRHPLSVDCFCCPCCCVQKITVGYVGGERSRLLGSVKQVCSACSSKFVVKNYKKKVAYKIRSPCCACSCLCCCCCDCTCNVHVDFQIFPLRVKTEIGRITGNLSAADRNIVSSETTYCFGINFPKEMDPEMKAVMIGAMFLIGFWFYEVQRNVFISMFE